MHRNGKSRGDRISYAINAANVKKMSALAMELGVDESAISRWKKNGKITLDNAGYFCELLDVSLDWIVLNRGHCFQHKQGPASSTEQKILIALRQLGGEPIAHLNDFLQLVLAQK